MMIEAAAVLVVMFAAFVFGYQTGYGKGQDDAEFRWRKRGWAEIEKEERARARLLGIRSEFDR